MTSPGTMVHDAQFNALGAGAFLVSILGVCLGAGALIGLAAGRVGIGIGIGALVGVPAGIAAVVARYRNRV